MRWWRAASSRLRVPPTLVSKYFPGILASRRRSRVLPSGRSTGSRPPATEPSPDGGRSAPCTTVAPAGTASRSPVEKSSITLTWAPNTVISRCAQALYRRSPRRPSPAPGGRLRAGHVLGRVASGGRPPADPTARGHRRQRRAALQRRQSASSSDDKRHRVPRECPRMFAAGHCDSSECSARLPSATSVLPRIPRAAGTWLVEAVVDAGS